MGKVSHSLFIGVLASALLSGVAVAADYTPTPVIDFEPEYEFDFGGNLYLRGYVGFSNQEVDDLNNALFSTAERVDILGKEFESGGVIGAAVGYRFNQWFRADVSAEYRMRTSFDGLDRADTTYDGAVNWDQTNQYRANKSEVLLLANAFVDLGNYHGLPPYVGAGVGASYTTISNFTDTNVPTNGVAFADDNSEWNLAWALHAGLGYEVNDRLTLELGYRYLHIGDASSGDIKTFTGVNNVNNPLEFEDITSHDFHVGMRWNLGGFSTLSSGYGY